MTEKGVKMSKSTRFEIRGDIVLDHQTGLEWERNPQKDLTWQQAMGYAKACKTGGFDDWRVPTVQELMTLINYAKRNPASDFPDMLARSFWSSSSYVNDTYYAWLVYFDNGHVYNGYKTYSYYARCARNVAGEQ